MISPKTHHKTPEISSSNHTYPFQTRRTNTPSRKGIPSLWTGLTASILRQSTYSTARFGIYNYLSHHIRQKSPHKLSTTQTVACAGVAGGLAGLIGNPTEIVLVRMCADGAKPSSQRFRYRNALEGLMRVGREEGLRAFFKGLTPNIIRSVLMSTSLLVSAFSSLPTCLFRIRTPLHTVLDREMQTSS